jgi:hypothetical protein
MNTIGASLGHSPATVSAQAPIGKAPVGLESPQNKNAALPPVEESSAAEKVRADQLSRPPQNSPVQAGPLMQAQAGFTKIRAAFQTGVASRKLSNSAIDAFGQVQRNQPDAPALVDKRA